MTNSASLPIGKYRLGMLVDGLLGLSEFSRLEYRIFARNFKDHKSYHAPDVDFIKQRWTVALGTVRGEVYKIAYFFETEERSTAFAVSTEVICYCQEQLGAPSEEKKAILIWDTTDGNVVLQLGRVGTTYMINLFETSSRVRTFRRLRWWRRR